MTYRNQVRYARLRRPSHDTVRLARAMDRAIVRWRQFYGRDCTCPNCARRRRAAQIRTASRRRS